MIGFEMISQFSYLNSHNESKASAKNCWICPPDLECQDDIVNICVYYDCIVDIAKNHILHSDGCIDGRMEEDVSLALSIIESKE